MWSVAIVDNRGAVVEVLCQGEPRLSGATSFAAGFGQSAKGAVVVLADAVLNELGAKELDRTESTRPVTSEQLAPSEETTVECILECINDLSSNYVESVFELCEGMQFLTVNEWDVYAFANDGISRINDASMCLDAAEYFRAVLDPQIFHATLLWPASVAMPSILTVLSRVKNAGKPTKTTLPTIGADRTRCQKTKVDRCNNQRNANQRNASHDVRFDSIHNVLLGLIGAITQAIRYYSCTTYAIKK